MRILHKTLLAIALTSALSASTTAALAGAAMHRSLDPAITVRFADLNLDTAEGTRTLYARIRSAAQTVCGPSFSLWDGSRLAWWKDCYRSSTAEAVAQIDRPRLTALHLHTMPTRPG
jgi:UrcA family protein